MEKFETLKPGWYLLKTKSREEPRAVQHLENQGFEAYCPEYLQKGRPVLLFPSYLFLRLEKQDAERYHKIRSTRGVSTMITFNSMMRKSYQAGHINTQCTDTLSKMLPQPIPDGEKIIEQIEEITWNFNGCKPEEKPESVSFEEGDLAHHKNSLFEHLKFTFVKGMKSDRGMFLVQFIESLRTEGGIEQKVVKEQTIAVKYGELEKV